MIFANFHHWYLENFPRYSPNIFSTHQNLLGEDSDAFSGESHLYSWKKPGKMTNFHEKIMKISIFHEIFEFWKIITLEAGETWRRFLPGTLHCAMSCYLESFSSKALLLLKIEEKKSKKLKKCWFWVSKIMHLVFFFNLKKILKEAFDTIH